jgi:hypothetical protein
MKQYDKALIEFSLALDRESQDPVLWHDRADVYLVRIIFSTKHNIFPPKNVNLVLFKFSRQNTFS